jgi:hypothetical protein
MQTQNSFFSFPTYVFIVAAVLLLGSFAWSSSNNMIMQPSLRDIWQHAATLRALISNLADPSNPFVVSDEGTRHFHLFWVGWAAVARNFGLSEWDVLELAAYFSMTLFGTGIFLFARAYHPSPWAPFVLLLTTLFGWTVSIQHTGFHSPSTLLYSAAYPATAMIGLSFILWAVTIRCLENLKFIVVLVPIVAIMFTTHQLGAVIGFVGAGCFILCWPRGTHKSRLIAILATVFGLGISMLWHYHNPLLIALRSGNLTWPGSSYFYEWPYLWAALIPSMVGVLGLQGPRSRPLALALILFICLYLIGLTGIKIAGRFLMPITLVLQVGLASYLLHIFEDPRKQRERTKLIIGMASVTLVLLHGVNFAKRVAVELEQRRSGANIFAAVSELTYDISDSEQVAASSGAAWPAVASGQRVLSIPWPEPAIHDLAQRQEATRLLFDPTLSRQERVDIARKYGVRTLIVDRRFLSSSTSKRLLEQTVRSDASGTMLRFDLFE